MATIAKVTSPDSPAWRPEGFTIVALQLYISVYFKGYCLRVWLPVSLKLRAEWDPSLRSSDISITRTYQEINQAA